MNTRTSRFLRFSFVSKGNSYQSPPGRLTSPSSPKIAGHGAVNGIYASKKQLLGNPSFVTMVNSDVLVRFTNTMKSVYGPFDALDPSQATAWTPPEDPGAGGHRGRYLWTDAFGIVNFLTLYKETSSPLYLALARQLVETVHDVLGRTRDGAARLAGATDEEPLRGGLRIGKTSATGSDADGQYHHYLTLWMFALNRLSLATSESVYNELAVQLARAIHPRFVFPRPSGSLRMVWKISMDMSSILVPSKGHLDAATGYVVFKLLQNTAAVQTPTGEPPLEKEIADYARIMADEGEQTPSGDFLDLGMGLWMCHFCEEEPWTASFIGEALELAKDMLEPSSRLLRRAASQRLAFREFGACLGIACVDADDQVKAKVASLLEFWKNHLQQSTEDDLRPISQVMYAAALVPGAFQKGYLQA
ncbi:hypothetical protein HJFPF1_06056 [Paramyrothecium foliicola]|nr:hypothetical protein HJFPF1_06056 [Paramyrothecium foliicola]